MRKVKANYEEFLLDVGTAIENGMADREILSYL